MRRFAQQISLPQVGTEGQDRLQRSRVALIGAGGLGTPVAVYLAAAGVGQLEIYDGDLVSEGNLHRQFIYSDADVGEPKAHVLGHWLRSRFPNTEIKICPEFLGKDLARAHFPNVDAVVDGTDNFAAKYLISDACVILKKPWVYGSLFQFEGRVAVFKGSSCLRCVFPEPPKAIVQNCQDAGILGATAGIIGSYQALEALKILLGNPNLAPQFGTWQVFDFLGGRNLILQESVRPDCRCRGPLNWSDVADFAQLSCSAVKADRLLDVREDEERRRFSRAGTLNWPLSELQNGRFPKLDPTSTYEIVCASGARARMALEILRQNEIQNVLINSGSIYESTNG